MVTGHSETTFQAFKKTEKYTMKEYKKGPPQRLSDFRLSLGKNGLRFHHGSNSGWSSSYQIDENDPTTFTTLLNLLLFNNNQVILR